nr:unnamed protein product [Digitaria exilis]
MEARAVRFRLEFQASSSALTPVTRSIFYQLLLKQSSPRAVPVGAGAASPWNLPPPAVPLRRRRLEA